MSEGTARAFWPGRDPVGQVIRLALDTSGSRHSLVASRRISRIVGVVPDVALGTIIDPFDSPIVYFPAALTASNSALLLRVSGTPEVVMRRLDLELSRLAPGAVEDIHTLDAHAAAGIYPFRAAYWIAGALGGIALLLTLAGVYGVLSYVVAQRRKELGIRVALGASPRQISTLMIGESMRLAFIGLALGSVLALGVARLFAANIVKMSTFEPVAFAGGALLVLVSCAIAGYVPARRASRVDPIKALRLE